MFSEKRLIFGEFLNMEQFTKITDIGLALNNYKAQGKTIGFVPTMGALHKGHLSLVTISKQNTDITVVSIFVNPTQFNDKNDLKNYPKTLDNDLRMLKQAGCDIVFVPSEGEVYPEPDSRVFDLGYLNTVMEGKHRAGHFNGVAQVVTKLFTFVSANKAFFGDKDFQQLAVIKKIVKDYNFNIEIVPCPIVREPDGLAMSSRNMLLNAQQREASVEISRVLFEAKKIFAKMTVSELEKWVIYTINLNPLLEVEYFEIVDDTELKPIISWNEPKNKVGCVAVRVGNIRLIDNVRF